MTSFGWSDKRRESNAMHMGKFDSTYFPDISDPLRQWGRNDLSIHRRLKEGHLLASGGKSHGQRHILTDTCPQCGRSGREIAERGHDLICSQYRTKLVPEPNGQREDLLVQRSVTHGKWAQQSEGAQQIKAA